MSEDGGSRSELQVVYNVDRILDCHTYLTGRESAEQILEYRGACGVEKAFVFALMLNAQAHEITSDSIQDSTASPTSSHSWGFSRQPPPWATSCRRSAPPARSTAT
jgi:hypothetical protein